MNRQEANREILKLLADMVEQYPDLRFGQILVNVDAVKLKPDTQFGVGYVMVDPFHEEPTETLSRMKNTINYYGYKSEEKGTATGSD